MNNTGVFSITTKKRLLRNDETTKIAESSDAIVAILRHFCLTETHQKYDRLDFSPDIRKMEQRREIKDKKGGGMMIIYNANACKSITLTKNDTYKTP